MWEERQGYSQQCCHSKRDTKIVNISLCLGVIIEIDDFSCKTKGGLAKKSLGTTVLDY